MTTQDNTKDPHARRVVREMVMEGEASPSEAAQLAGVSRQLAAHWIGDINWRRARKTVLVKSWRTRMKASRR